MTLDECVRKYKLIEQYCAEFARDPHSVERTLHREVYIARDGKQARLRALQSKPGDLTEEAFLKSRIVGDPDECLNQFNEYVREAGSDTSSCAYRMQQNLSHFVYWQARYFRE